MNSLNEEPFIIQSLQKEIEIQHLNKNIVTCLKLLSDGRILTGHLGGGICIISTLKNGKSISQETQKHSIKGPR